jgi:hypothetical protein
VAAPVNATLPPFFVLTRGMQVRVATLDPTDGSAVTGVVVTNMSLSVEQEDAATPSQPPPISGALLPGMV